MTSAGKILGRADDLSAIHSAFEESRRVVTLVGPGGVGKTTTARAFFEAWPGNSWFVDLQSAAGEQDVVQAVASRVLGVSVSADVEQISCGIAQGEPTLLVLDNADEVVPYVRGLVEALTPLAPDLHMLVTSRQRLESVFEAILGVSPLSEDEAVELFCVCARGRDPEYEPAVEDVLSLVKQLDCLPLAIELAAARIRVLSAKDMVQRIDDQGALLRRRGGEEDRHGSLDACVSWSLSSLEPREALALKQLSLISGPFTVGDAEQMHDGAVWIGDILDALVERSLVQIDPKKHARFSILNTVRRVVLSSEAIERPMVQRWAGWLLGEVKSHTAERMEHLLPQVVRAFDLLMEHDPPAAIELLLAADRPLRRAGPLERVHHMYASAFGAVGTDFRTRAQLLLGLASLLTNLGRIAEAAALLDEAQGLVEGQAEHADLWARLLQIRGYWKLGSGLFDEALLAFETAEDVAPADIDPGLMAHILGGQSVSQLHLRDAEQALLLAERGLVLAGQSPDPAQLGRAMGWKANALAALDRLEEAAILLEESMRHLQRAGDMASLSNRGLTLAELKLGIGGDAADWIEGSIDASRIWGSWISVARAKSLVARRDGDVDQARWAVDELRDLDYYPPRGVVLTFAILAAEVGDFQAADVALARVLASVDDPNERQWLSGFQVAFAQMAGDDQAALRLETRPEVAERLGVCLKNGSFVAVSANYADPFLRCEYAFLAEPAALMEAGGGKESATLRVLDEGKQVVLPSGDEIDLAKRHTLRRFFMFMVAQHENSPGQDLDLSTLMEGGWPDQMMTFESGSQRVYAAIKQLRKIGLGPVVHTGENGYRIATGMVIKRI